MTKAYFEIKNHKFSNDVLAEIIRLEFISGLSKVEMGFDLCKNKDTNIIYARNRYKGSQHQISLKGKCAKNEELVGGFHTHSNSPQPSLADVINIYVKGMSIISGNETWVYIRTIPPNKESFDLMLEYDNKYKNYITKHGKLSKELQEERTYITKIIIDNAFSVTRLKF